MVFCLDWHGSLGWVSSSKAQGLRFDSWSGHMPGLCARSSLVGGHVRDNWSTFLSLSSSLPSPISKNKWINYFKNKLTLDFRWLWCVSVGSLIAKMHDSGGEVIVGGPVHVRGLGHKGRITAPFSQFCSELLN